ncbi:MAG: hypothetical protein ACRDHY_09860 [Anaerolineales bacterium]
MSPSSDSDGLLLPRHSIAAYRCFDALTAGSSTKGTWCARPSSSGLTQWEWVPASRTIRPRADAVGGTELGDRDDPAQSTLSELLAQLHRDDLLPRHRTLLEEPEPWR